MAEKQAGGLSMRIGIALSELQSDFLQAEQTVRQGIAALNRQQNIVRLRMETDVAGLDSFADKTKIIEVREQALSQLLEMQRDKLTLATKAFQDYTSGKNVNATESKRLETAMERERLAVARLESELKKLSAQKVSIDVSGLQSNIEKISARIQNIRIKAEVDTSQLQGANAAFDAQKIHIAAVTKELELQRKKLVELQEIRRQLEKTSGSDSVQTINIKSNILQQIQEINRLETKLKELKSTDINLQFRADSIRNVEVAIQENISRINARIDNIRIKSEIDTSKLGTAATEFDKAKVHVAALNQELTLQKQKLAELQAAMYNSAKASGSNSSQTIKLRGDILKQIQAIDQLKAKIEELNKIQPPKSNLLSNYLNIKGDVAGKLSQITSVFSGLSAASQSADGAITKSLEVISAIPHPVGRAVAALAALPLVFVGIENSVVDMLRATASAGDSVYVMSRGFQMSIADTGKFTSMCKTAGVEVNDLASTIRRTQQQIIRGGENAKAENWLKRYGESAFDASGHLKNMNEMTLTLSRALKRAQAEGNGMAFILGTIRTASADAITAIEDAEGVYKQAAGLVKNGLLDPAFAHEVQGNLNALNLQTSFMTSTFKSALLPVANEIVPRLTERMAKLTQVIADNKDLVKDFGETLAEAFGMIEGVAEGAAMTVGSVVKAIHDLATSKRKETVELFLDDKEVDSVEKLMEKDFLRAGREKELKIVLANPDLYNQTYAKYEPIFKAIDDARKEIERKNKELAETLQKPLTSVADISSAGAERNNGFLDDRIDAAKEAVKQTKALSDELYKITHTDYENKKFDVLNWQQELLNSEKTTAYERGIVEEIAAEKIKQIEEEKEQKLAEIRQRISSAEKTELENHMIAIEDEKDAWIQAGMEKAEAEQLAQKQLNDYLKNSHQELSDKVQSLYQTELESRLSQIEKEKQAWIDKCADEVKATELAEQQKVDAQRAAAMSVLRQQAQEYEVYQKGGYAGLRAYKAAELERQGVNSDYLYMTPQQLSDFQKASQVADKSMLPNFMTDHDRYEHQQQMQNWQDWRTQQNAEYDKQNYAITNGVKTGMSEALGNTPLTIEIGKNNAEEGHTISVSPNGDRYTRQDDKYSYDKNGNLTQKDSMTTSGMLPTISEPLQQYTESLSELPQAVQGITESFSELPTAVQSAAESLNELPTAVQGVMEQISAIEPQQLPQDTELPSILSEVAQSFSQLPTVIQTASDSLNGLPVMVSGLKENLTSEVSQLFSPMSESLTTVTVKFSDLGAALDSFLSQLNSASINQSQSQPIEVNNTISIDEAHAWDYDHIQELAEKVADIIEPTLLRSIGGDSNSY